jgi:hypothetical protein
VHVVRQDDPGIHRERPPGPHDSNRFAQPVDLLDEEGRVAPGQGDGEEDRGNRDGGGEDSATWPAACAEGVEKPLTPARKLLA